MRFLIAKKAGPFPVVPPHVEYQLTPLGRECARRVGDLVEWIESHVRAVARAQYAYDAEGT